MSAFGGKADMPYCGAHVCFRGKADMTYWGNTLSRSLLGVKRTWLFAPHMSAYDPKRTSTSSLKVVHFEQTHRPDRLTLSVEPKEIPALVGSGNGELATKRLNHPMSSHANYDRAIKSRHTLSTTRTRLWNG